MATKTITAWIDGAVQEIEVENIVSEEQDKTIVDMAPDEVLDYIDGATIEEVTTDEWNAIDPKDINTIYKITDYPEEHEIIMKTWTSADIT